MTEDSPRIELGKPPGKLAKASRPPGRGLLLFVVLLQIVIVVFIPLSFLRTGGRLGGGAAAPADSVRAKQLRAVALDLEHRGLSMEAARQWERYLAAAPSSKERARILYRIGSAYFDAHDFEKAAAAFVRAEHAPDCDEALKGKIGPKMVDALRGAGLYSEVGRELARRTAASAGKTPQGKVLATLGNEPLTDKDLDRMINFRVDRMLALQGASAAPETRAALYKQMTDPKTRRQILGDIIRTEILSRRARELGLDKGDDFKNALGLAEQELLATMFLEKELGKVAPTRVDLEDYFNAHKEDYRDEKTGKVPDFETAAKRVQSDYVSRKRSELMEKLVKDLMTRYDVRIMAAAPQAPHPQAAPKAPGHGSAGQGTTGKGTGKAPGKAPGAGGKKEGGPH